MKPPCVFKIETLFGIQPCGKEGAIYDRARRRFLCRDHKKERLCQFQVERAWRWVWQEQEGIATEVWLCRSCTGCSVRRG